MNKINKLILVITISLAVILGINTETFAKDWGEFDETSEDNIYSYQLGDTMRYKRNGNRGKLYCLNKGNSGGDCSYTLVDKLTIEGKKCTSSDGTSNKNKANAKLAAILLYANQNWQSSQEGIWNYVKTWYNESGHQFSRIGYISFDGDYVSMPSEVENSINEYMNSFHDNSEGIEDITDYSKVECKRKGTDYWKFGPFQVFYDGTLTNFEIRNRETNEVIPGAYVGKGDEQWEMGQVTSEGKFWIYIPQSQVTSDNRKIKVHMENTFPGNKRSVDMWWFKAGISGYQNLIYARDTGTVPENDKLNINYDIPLSNLKIIKVDETDNSTRINGVCFNIYDSQTEKYIGKDGTRKENPDNSDAIFVTGEGGTDGEIYVENLLAGNYTIIERTPLDGATYKTVNDAR